MLGDCVSAGDSKVDSTLTNESGDIGGGKEDEGEREVLDKRNVEAVVTVELDVAARKEVEAGYVQAAL